MTDTLIEPLRRTSCAPGLWPWFGKRPARRDRRTLCFRDYLAERLVPPEALNNAAAVLSWPMYFNDWIGDCTCAGAGHAIQCWTANAGRPATPSDAEIIATYMQFGFKPGDPSTDRGAYALDVLNYWRQVGIAGHRIAAYAAVDPYDTREVQTALGLCGLLYLGVMLPASVCRDRPALHPWSDAVQDLPNARHGHAVIVAGYGPAGLVTVTWGDVKVMSWGFFQRYVDECYALVTPEWIEADGKKPSGFDLAALKADLIEVSA